MKYLFEQQETITWIYTVEADSETEALTKIETGMCAILQGDSSQESPKLILGKRCFDCGNYHPNFTPGMVCDACLRKKIGQ